MPSISELSRDGFWYLASPYSDPSPDVRVYRAACVVIAAGDLAKKELPVYSPIASWHIASGVRDLPTDADWWRKINLPFMQKAKGLIVLTLDGWKDSKGVRMEMEYFAAYEDEPHFLDPILMELVPRP